MAINAFASELRQIKLAQSLPMAKVVGKLMSGVGRTVVSPAVKKTGLGRAGQLLTGSRQAALADDYLRAGQRVIKKAPSSPIAGVRSVGGGQAARTSKWKDLGEMAKSELAERKAVQGARNVAGGALGASGLSFTAGAAQ